MAKTKIVLCLLSALVFWVPRNAVADINVETLSAITSSAAEICGAYQSNGFSIDAEVESAVGAEFSGLVDILIDAGAVVESDIDLTIYEGLTQEILIDDIQSVRDCRIHVFDNLKHLIIDRSSIIEEVVRVISRWSSWRGGGYNQAAWCNDLRSSVEEEVEAPVTWRVITSTEESRSDIFRNFEYRYYCNAEYSFIVTR